MLLGELLKDVGHNRARNAQWTSDPHLSGTRIGQQLNFIDALLELVEDDERSSAQGLTVSCRFDALRAPIEQFDPDHLLQMREDFRHRWRRNAELARGHGHAAVLHHRKEYMQLHVFLAVVQHGSMDMAARQLGISTPTVSEILAHLEQVVGVKLLDRSPKGVEPTRY